MLTLVEEMRNSELFSARMWGLSECPEENDVIPVRRVQHVRVRYAECDCRSRQSRNRYSHFRVPYGAGSECSTAR